MENNNISVVEKTTAEQTPENPVLTMEYILTRIDRIIEDTGHIRSALESLNTSGDDVTGQARAEAIKSTVQCRETTNQQLIRLLEKMYEDMPHRDSLREKALTIVERAMIDTTLESDAQETLSTLLDTVRHIGH